MLTVPSIDIVSEQELAERYVRAMEARALAYWQDWHLGRDGEWVTLTHTGTPWRSLTVVKVRIVADRVFFQGDIYNQSEPFVATTSAAFILPADFRPEMTLRVNVATSAEPQWGPLRVEPDGSVYVVHQERSLHYLAGLHYPVNEAYSG